jgi:hypothetical protein
MIKENPLLLLRYSKLLVNKPLDYYSLVFELLLSDLYSDFKQYLELWNSDSSEISLVAKLRYEATSSMIKENPVLPLR